MNSKSISYWWPPVTKNGHHTPYIRSTLHSHVLDSIGPMSFVNGKPWTKKVRVFFLLCPHSKAIMVKGWILDLPIIPQPIVFLCIVLAAQPTLSWSLSDLDQWAHFSQYLGLCQQKLHILIVMCCKRQKCLFYVRLNLSHSNTLRHSSYWMNMDTLT